MQIHFQQPKRLFRQVPSWYQLSSSRHCEEGAGWKNVLLIGTMRQPFESISQQPVRYCFRKVESPKTEGRGIPSCPFLRASVKVRIRSTGPAPLLKGERSATCGIRIIHLRAYCLSRHPFHFFCLQVALFLLAGFRSGSRFCRLFQPPAGTHGFPGAYGRSRAKLTSLFFD